MMMIVAGAVAVLGFAISYFSGSRIAKSKLTEAEVTAKAIVDEADREAKNLKKEKLQEVKDEWQKKRQEFESENQSKRNKVQQQEKQIRQREEGIDSKLEMINKKEKQLQSLDQDIVRRQDTVKKKEEDINGLLAEQNHRLERITGMSRDDARKFLMENMVNEAKEEGAVLVKEVRDEAKKEAQKEAQKIILQAIQRTGSDYCVENTVSMVHIASEEMKGRIIGREGRNIRAFEAATGIDLVIDDTPEAVVISGFDPFRREVARVALEKLMNDGRIHPTRIEELVEKTRKELEEEMVRTGENTLLELGIHNVHPELIRYIGRMKYRASYGQNLLSHSIEVARLCGIMAGELNFDIPMAKRAGLLHDIGKCMEMEGPHALLGMDLAKKFKEHHLICNAIGAHHDDIEMESPIAVLVQSADSISGSRPGARRESLENYIKRLEKLEAIASAQIGVTKTYAIQAGREIRVIVEPERVDDLMADTLAHDIAKRIESEMEYPGQIKVTVIRERRSFGIAK